MACEKKKKKEKKGEVDRNLKFHQITCKRVVTHSLLHHVFWLLDNMTGSAYWRIFILSTTKKLIVQICSLWVLFEFESGIGPFFLTLAATRLRPDPAVLLVSSQSITKTVLQEMTRLDSWLWGTISV